MENTTVKAQGKYIRQSPYKMRLVLNLIRGLDVQEALNVLTFTKRRAAVEIKQVLESAISNAEAELTKLGKAGRSRWKGVRPQTRGVAMNPVDHPLGGGEGKSSGGRVPVSPWGKPEKKTRKKKKYSNKSIVRRRSQKGRN